MNNEEIKAEIEEWELEIYEQQENLRELKLKRDKLKRKDKCEHIYQQNGYITSLILNNKRIDVPIIKCIKCGDLAYLKIGR